jgi:hypothetical protein
MVSRVSLGIDPFMDATISHLTGAPVGLDGKSYSILRRRSSLEGGRSINQYLHLILEEALYAAEDFYDEHGYLPWQPRFSIVLTEDGRPECPRRHERCAQERTIDELLKKVGDTPV